MPFFSLLIGTSSSKSRTTFAFFFIYTALLVPDLLISDSISVGIVKPGDV